MPEQLWTLLPVLLLILAAEFVNGWTGRAQRDRHRGLDSSSLAVPGRRGAGDGRPFGARMGRV